MEAFGQENGGGTEHKVEIEWKQFDFLSAISGLYTTSVERKKCTLEVFVQGDIHSLDGKMVVLTVHDVGKNHLCFVDYVNSPAMAQLRDRAVFLHVCVPGQAPDAQLFVGSYPSMEQLGDAMAQILQHFDVKSCFAVGEGAGADICCRFALDFPQLVTGLVLVHCTSTPHGIVEHVKEILAGLRLDDGEMKQTGWNYLLTHRYGNHNLDAVQQHYVDLLKSGMNERNLSRYLYSFAHRSDFTDRLKEGLQKVDVFLVTGGKAPHNGNMMHMFNNMKHEQTGLLMVEGVMDVLEEAPDNVTSALISLGQRHGLCADLSLPVLKRREEDEESKEQSINARHHAPSLIQHQEANALGMFRDGMADLAFQA